MDAAVWGALAFLVFALEMFTLARKTDGWQPLTYYVKRLMRMPLLYGAFLAFWLWLGWHFFLES